MSAAVGMLAAGFVHPALLGGLALIAAPILIHWLSRRQFRTLDWAAMRFLLEAERENRRRLRFEQWLLVALRCAAMAVLALLFARPYLQPGLIASLLGGRGNVERIVLIDDSLSTRYSEGSGVEFDTLRAAAARLVSWLNQEAPTDPLTVLLTSSLDEPLVQRQAPGAADLQELLARLERLTPGALPARPRAALGRVAGLLTDAGPAGRADLYVLSDFQRSEWLAPDESGRPVFSELDGFEPARLRLVLIASGMRARDNLAVTELALARPRIIAGQPATVRVTVANHGRRPARDLAIEPALGHAGLPTVSLEPIPPGRSQTAQFEITAAAEGWTTLSVRLSSADGLREDDARELCLDVRPELRVLLVDGEPDADPLKDEVHRLRNALSPPGPFTSGIRTHVIDAESLEVADLEAYDCVLLCNVPAPGAAVADALLRYVRGGGGLAVFVGARVEPEAYNEALYASGAGVLAAPLGELVSRAGDAGAGVGLVREGEHPVTAMLAAGGQEVAETFRFRAFLRVNVPDATVAGPGGLLQAGRAGVPGATVIARFTDAERSAALVERSVGAGRSCLFASTADLEWNDWARAVDGSYVVTMLELVQHLARRGTESAPLRVGERLSVAIRLEEYEAAVQFRTPLFPQEPAEPGVAELAAGRVGQPVTVQGPVARQPGVYMAELRRGDGTAESRPLAVNVDPIESDLASAGAEELRRAAGAIPTEYVASAAAFVRRGEQSRLEVWPSLVVLLVGLLLGEQALACWFGSERRLAGASMRRAVWSLAWRRRARRGAA